MVVKNGIAYVNLTAHPLHFKYAAPSSVKSMADATPDFVVPVDDVLYVKIIRQNNHLNVPAVKVNGQTYAFIVSDIKPVLNKGAIRILEKWIRYPKQPGELHRFIFVSSTVVMAIQKAKNLPFATHTDEYTIGGIVSAVDRAFKGKNNIQLVCAHYINKA